MARTHTNSDIADIMKVAYFPSEGMGTMGFMGSMAIRFPAVATTDVSAKAYGLKVTTVFHHEALYD